MHRVLPLALAGATLAAAGGAEAQTWQTFSSARQVWDREPIDVRVQYGAGELKLRPADEPMLYQMEMRYDEDSYTPVTRFDAERRVLRLGVEGKDDRRGPRIKGGAHANISLTRAVPLDLDLSFGAGDAEIDLGGVSLRRLDLHTGASETTVRFDAPNRLQAERVRIQSGAADLRVIGLGNARSARFSYEGGVGSTLLDFSGAWERDATASVQMGIGSVTLRVPRGLGVRVNKETLLTRFDPEGLVKRGNSYFSTDWDTAPHQLTIDLSAALGSVAIEWIQ